MAPVVSRLGGRSRPPRRPRSPSRRGLGGAGAADLLAQAATALPGSRSAAAMVAITRIITVIIGHAIGHCDRSPLTRPVPPRLGHWVALCAGDRLGGAAGRGRTSSGGPTRRTRTCTWAPRPWSTTAGSCVAATSRTRRTASPVRRVRPGRRPGRHRRGAPWRWQSWPATAPTSPCGRCRQVLYEFGGPDLLVDTGEARPTRLGELLPGAFGPTTGAGRCGAGPPR